MGFDARASGDPATIASTATHGEARPPADERWVSVVLTYCRSGDTIFQAIGSVLAQSHPRFELLLVDDNDAEARQIEALAARISDPRVRFLANPRRGRVHALRFGVAEARHEICAIIDDDDLWHPDKLAWDLAALDRERGVVVVCWPAVLFTDGLRFPAFNAPPRLRQIPIGRMLVRNRVVHSSVTSYRELLSYDAELLTSEDYELFLRLQWEGHALHQYDQPRVGQRIHGSNFLSRGLLRFYWRSAAIQARYIVRWRRYHLLVFPALRVLYTLVRRQLMKLRARRNSLTGHEARAT